jgi:hypothetical protein
MSARSWCDCIAGATCFLLAPSVKLGRWVVGSCPRERGCLGGRCDCQVPPPCWVPVRLDDLSEHVGPGDTAVVRLAVTNDGATSRTFEIAASDPLVVVKPTALTLGPLERGVAVLSLTVPATAAGDHVEQCVVSVRGCKQYNFRWTVSVSRRRDHRHHKRCGVLFRRHHDCDRALHMAVEDRPDYVHHWYDHFYCERPCLDS